MIVSLHRNRRRMVILLAMIGLLAAVYLTVCRSSSDGQKIAGASNEERLAYINGFGWKVETEPEDIAEVTLPEQFNAVYTAYNALQQREGFDLLKYAGKTCTQYKYVAVNTDAQETVYISLLVYEGNIIGADVSSAQLGGFMHGINEKPQVQAGEVSAYEGNLSAETSSAGTEESSAPAG